MSLTPNSLKMEWETSLMDFPFLHEHLFKLVAPMEQSVVAIVSAPPEEQPLLVKNPPPSGTIFAYNDKESLQNDQPVVLGNLGDLINHNSVRPQNAYKTHLVVRRSVQTEFAFEDAYRREVRANCVASPREKRRRSPKERDWKPESVYKTFVDCKPSFFDKSDYQDRVPATSCFGKINMRIPKAWSRGPNRPVKRMKLNTKVALPLPVLPLPHIETLQVAMHLAPPQTTPTLQEDQFAIDFLFI